MKIGAKEISKRKEKRPHYVMTTYGAEVCRPWAKPLLLKRMLVIAGDYTWQWGEICSGGHLGTQCWPPCGNVAGQTQHNTQNAEQKAQERTEHSILSDLIEKQQQQ